MLMLAFLAVLPFSNSTQTAQLTVLAVETADPVTWLFNLGTAGIWLACYLTGLLPTKGEVNRLVAEIDRLVEDAKRREEKATDKDKAVETLISLMAGRTMPALAQAVAELPQQAQPESAYARRLEEALERIERLGNERPT